MTERRTLRSLLSDPGCHRAAPIFDPLSARLADMRGWTLCKLSGTVWKGAELALPDDMALANSSDLVDIARRILRVADVQLIVDADEGFGTAVNVARTVRDLEAVGVAGIEIEDSFTPRYHGQGEGRYGMHVGLAEQVGKLEAAVEARRHADTAIIARTLAMRDLPEGEALERIAAYAAAGVDALMLPGLGLPRDGRADIEQVRSVTDLPILAFGLPMSVQNDPAFLEASGVKVLYSQGFAVYRAAIKAMDDALGHLQAGGDPALLSDALAPMEMVHHSPRAVTRSSVFREWSSAYVRDPSDH